MTVLFAHGAGGYDDDRALARVFADVLDTRVRLPRLPDDMTYDAWSAAIRAELAGADTIIGHSFGGSIVLRMLGEGDLEARRMLLLAAPDWGPEGWDHADYALPPDLAARVPEGVEIALHHCVDDEVVPVAHLGLLATRLPQVRAVEHPRGGHQFDGEAAGVIARGLAAGTS